MATFYDIKNAFVDGRVQGCDDSDFEKLAEEANSEFDQWLAEYTNSVLSRVAQKIEKEAYTTLASPAPYHDNHRAGMICSARVVKSWQYHDR